MTEVSDQENPSNKTDFLRKKPVEVHKNVRDRNVVTIISIIALLLVSLAGLWFADKSRDQDYQIKQKELLIKEQEVKFKQKQLDDSIDPLIFNALLNSETREAAILLGNGLYLRTGHDETVQWWCKAISEIGTENKECTIAFNAINKTKPDYVQASTIF